MVTCRILAVRESAVVKTSRIAGTQFQNRPRNPGRSLLCGQLRSPTEVSFAAEAPELWAFWGPARQLWELNQQSSAFADLTETVRRFRNSPGISIPTQFLIAQMKIDAGEIVAAERCLQHALKQLGQQTRIRTIPVFQHSGFKGGNSRQSYTLCNRDWLVLAIHAILKNDLESCLSWIFQADRRLFEPVSASKSDCRLRLNGDLHAVLACVAVQMNELNEAETFLATATEHHTRADAFRSVCRDLILTSRLARIKGQTQRAARLLQTAESSLMVSLPPSEAQRCPLMQVIYAN